MALPGSALTVDESNSINFATMGYEPSWLYEGAFVFKKHYFGNKPGELEERRADGKEREEFRCAQYLDGLEDVRFWARNLSKRSSSFRLQTATDWFYPDFICMLTDGRVMAVEYKGGDRVTNDDSRDKQAVGAVWESRSGGKCLFVMPSNGDFAAIKKKIGV